MLILASASPRRREILATAGIPFRVETAGVPEVRLDEESPSDYVIRLAASKAFAIPFAAGDVVLGADTVVVLDHTVLEKPGGPGEAVSMLKSLSGREHRVLTGICLRHGGGAISDIAETKVRFCPLSADDVEDYIRSGEWMDKAGAYAIQGLACRFAQRIDGCYFNVVGLPIALVWNHLRRIEAASQISTPG